VRRHRGGAFLRAERPSTTELRDLQVDEAEEPYNNVDTSSPEGRACARTVSELRPSPVTRSTKGTNWYEQNSVTLDDPAARRIFPALPDDPAFEPYRIRHYFGRVVLADVNLAVRAATLRLTLSPGTQQGGKRPEPFPRGTRLRLSIQGSAGSGEQEISSALGEDTIAPVAITIPLNGAPEAYPSDSYHAALGLAKVRAQIPGKPDSYYAIDLGHVRLGPGIATSVTATQIPGRILEVPGRDCQTSFAIVITRTGGATFVWLMAAVPLLLLLIVAHSLWRAVRHDSASSALGRSTAVQAGVAFLAILSLRAVLVPQEISAFTRVDYVLAAELSLLVFALCAGALIAELPGEDPDRNVGLSD
jgi:hypothetical protein